MKEIILAFRSRTHALKLHDILKNEGYFVSLTPTPSKLGNGCSMSVKTEECALSRAQEVIEDYLLRSFIGAYEISSTNMANKLF